MIKELREILDFYEEEKASLEELIKIHIEEEDYKLAHRHKKALKYTSELLSLFKKLENPSYQEIELLQIQLDNYSNKKFKEAMSKSPGTKSIIESRVQILKNELQLLLSKTGESQMDSQEFDDVIFDLVEGKHKSFRFFLNIESNLYLEFEKVDQSIFINIPKYKKLKKNYILPKSNRNKLKDIGFKLTDDKKRLVFVYDTSSFKDANPIKTIVSRVIYEGFGHQYLKNSSVIVIID